MQGAKGLRGVAGCFQGPLGVQVPFGTTGVQGERGPEGHYGTQGLVGEKGDRGERGAKGEKGIQCDTSDVLSVLADDLPIQLATRYGEKMCFVKYHVSENRLEVWKRYVMLAHTKNPRDIVMLNLSMVKDM